MINAIVENGTHTDIVEYVAKQESDTKRAQANEDHYRALALKNDSINAEMKQQLKMAKFLATLITETEYKLFADCCGLGHLTRSHIKRFAHDMIHGAEMFVGFIPDYHEKKRQIEEEKTAKKNQARKRPRPYQPAHY